MVLVQLLSHENWKSDFFVYKWHTTEIGICHSWWLSKYVTISMIPISIKIYGDYSIQSHNFDLHCITLN